MSNINFISPIRLDGPLINSSDLYVSPSGPNPDREISCEVTIDVPSDQSTLHEDGIFRLVHSMEVSVTLSQETENDQNVLMHARLSMSGTVSIPEDVEVRGGSVEDALLLNGVSLFYSSARAYIETLTAMSCMGRFTIPAIDPSAYIRTMNEK